MRNLSIFFCAACLLAACGQGTGKSGGETIGETHPVSVEDLISDASSYVDQTVKVTGTVVHVCRHGGQRMFIIGQAGNERFRITTGENIAEFDVELEGEKVEVTGTVMELIIDETYLAEWEAEVREGNAHDRGEGHKGGIGHGDDHSADAGHESEKDLEHELERIQSVRDEIAQSGQDHLSDYWVETLEFNVLKN
jgi:hypothetical protein